MAHDMIPAADAFDFSKYQPGDVITISMREIATRGLAESIMLFAAIRNAASRVGLEWTAERDETEASR